MKATQEQMQWYNDLRANKTGIWWKITAIKTGKFVGACGFNNWNHERKSAEIGMWLLPDFWGKGIMQEALNAAFEYGFERMGLEKIEAFVEKGNSKCQNALDKMELKYVRTDTEEKNGVQIEVETFVKEKN
jgi:ribosomal-protein-alanine N-acetyltransferase